MIYEFRNYEAAPGKMNALHERFEKHTLRLWPRHGVKAVGFWTYAVGGYNDRLVYMLAFEDFAQREQAWKSFRADEEWQKVYAESEREGALVTRLTNAIWVPTRYSPMQ